MLVLAVAADVAPGGWAASNATALETHKTTASVLTVLRCPQGNDQATQASEMFVATHRKRKRETGSRSRRPPREYSSPACFLPETEARRDPDGAPDVEIQRIYDELPRAAVFRVLVDRLWPRDVKKENVALDAWARDLAPSMELRKWFAHDRQRWPEFRERYRAELRERATDLEALRQRARQQPVILLYAAKDKQFNHAVVLREVIRDG